MLELYNHDNSIFKICGKSGFRQFNLVEGIYISKPKREGGGLRECFATEKETNKVVEATANELGAFGF